MTFKRISLQQLEDLALFCTAPEEDIKSTLEEFRTAYGEELIFSEEFLLKKGWKPHEVPTPHIVGWILFSRIEKNPEIEMEWLEIVQDTLLGNLAELEDKKQKIELDYYPSPLAKQGAMEELYYWVTYYWRVEAMKALIAIVNKLPDFDNVTYQLIL